MWLAGIGKSIARKLAGQGLNVVLVGVREGCTVCVGLSSGLPTLHRERRRPEECLGPRPTCYVMNPPFPTRWMRPPTEPPPGGAGR